MERATEAKGRGKKFIPMRSREVLHYEHEQMHKANIYAVAMEEIARISPTNAHAGEIAVTFLTSKDHFAHQQLNRTEKRRYCVRVCVINISAKIRALRLVSLCVFFFFF